MRKIVVFVVTSTLAAFFWQHILICIWIKLGAAECGHPGWQDRDSVSWMFITESDFSGDLDTRTIFEQISDPESPKKLTSLYIYACYWVMTVVSTVGYGHLSYQTSSEYLYACFLELLSFLI